jgi:hypothetical protein
VMFQIGKQVGLAQAFQMASGHDSGGDHRDQPVARAMERGGKIAKRGRFSGADLAVTKTPGPASKNLAKRLSECTGVALHTH